MKDGVRDGRSRPGDSDFADAGRAQSIELVIRNVERLDVDLRDAGVDRHAIVREVRDPVYPTFAVFPSFTAFSISFSP